MGYRVPRTYLLRSPLKKHSVKRLVRGSYRKVMSEFASSVHHQKIMAGELARSAKRQIRQLSGKKASMVFGRKEDLAEFTWDLLWDELVKEVPVLIFFLKKLTRDVETSKPMICLIISMILKNHNNAMCLLQNIVSALLYGNSCSTQVSVCIYM